MLPQWRFVLGGTLVTVSCHGVAVVLAVAAGAALAARRAREPALAVAVSAGVALGALVGAHALFAALRGGAALGWSGGLASMGGIGAGLLVAWLLARLAGRPAAELLDVVAPAGLLALAIGRIGCFLGGCCFGRPTSLPWGVVFREVGPPPRHPLQLYSAAADLALLALLPPRARAPGAVARRACVGFGLLRAALECLRDPGATDALAGGWATLPQVVALALAAGAALAPTLRPRGASTMAPRREQCGPWPMGDQ